MKLKFFNKQRIASLGGALILLANTFSLSASAKKEIDKNILGVNASFITSENLDSLVKEKTTSVELNIVNDKFMPLSGVKYNILDENGEIVYSSFSVLGKNKIDNLPFDGVFYVECIDTPCEYNAPQFNAKFEIINGKLKGGNATIQLHSKKDNNKSNNSNVSLTHYLCEKDYFNPQLVESASKGSMLMDFYNLGEDKYETTLNFVVVDEDGKELIPKYSSSIYDEMGYYIVTGLEEGHKYKIEFKGDNEENNNPYLPSSTFIYEYDFTNDVKDLDNVDDYYKVVIANYWIYNKDDAIKNITDLNNDCSVSNLNYEKINNTTLKKSR